MCIICNCSNTGDQFLIAFAEAQHAMRKAAEAMLECSKVATDRVARVGYDRAHKAIVRQIREWNALEHSREQGHMPPDGVSE